MDWESDISIIIFIVFCVFLIILAFKFFIFFIIEDIKTHNEIKINDSYLEKEAELKELREHYINIQKQEKDQKKDEL